MSDFKFKEGDIRITVAALRKCAMRTKDEAESAPTHEASRLNFFAFECARISNELEAQLSRAIAASPLILPFKGH